MSKYLYGAAVQGIQGFIFQTNKLQEIVGASELVEEICTDFFKEQVGEKFKDENLVLGAAGNIKYIFESKEECEVFVRHFPKEVMEKAPGITISQAVVKYEEGKLNDSLQDLEDKLREQRNKISIPYEVGFMGTERSRRTGGVAYKARKKRKGDFEYIDEATHLKRKKGDPYYSEKYADEDKETLFRKISGLETKDYDVKKDLIFDIDEIKSSWIAVIHADGNGLGSIIQNLNKSFKEKNKSDEEVKKGFKRFSQALDNATKAAARDAVNKTVKTQKKEGVPYPIRPIILGGDDLTVIIRADLAFDFTKHFLQAFEETSNEELKFLTTDFGLNNFKDGITACAGIAYVKSSYPFHYAVDLAKKLCSDAKNFVKGKTKEYENRHPEMNVLIPKSALAFFKVQDSFIEDSLNDMKNRVLKNDNIDFRYGPYLVSDIDKKLGFAHVCELEEKLKVVEEQGQKADKGESNGISKLRQWATEVFRDTATADFFLERMETVNKNFYNDFKPKEIKNGKSIVYDVIQLNTF